MSEFAKLLCEYRSKTYNPQTKKRLTQQKLAELLANKLGILSLTGATISNWELAKNKIAAVDRNTLINLVEVLCEYGGIRSLSEANVLLGAGSYANLFPDEIAKISLKLHIENPSNDEAVNKTRYSFIDKMGQPISLSTSIKIAEPPFMTPSLPPQGIWGRDEILSTIIDLLALDSTKANISPIALQGMGGIGKTTLAKAIGRLGNIQTLFPDGVLWVELGLNPTIRILLDIWGRALGIDLIPEPNEEACRSRLQSVLYHRRVLLIIDDIWEAKHGKYFTVAGPNCRTLLTTREKQVTQALVTPERTLKIDLLSEDASLSLLRSLAPDAFKEDIEGAKKLCQRLQYLPLALTLAGRLLASESDVPSKIRRLVDELIERHKGEGSPLQLIQAEGRGSISDEPVSIKAILGLSVDRLDKVDRERFAMSAVFGSEPFTWSIDAAASVWQCSVESAEDTTSRLIQRGLVDRRRENDRYWMHQLLYDYAKEMMEALKL